ncbi:unnamed protein product [Diamesa serratosioi]
MTKVLILFVLFCIFVSVNSAPIVGGNEVNLDLLSSTTESSGKNVNTFIHKHIAQAGSGALIGGVFGSFVAPGLGTAVGATIGSFFAPLISHCISFVFED